MSSQVEDDAVHLDEDDSRVRQYRRGDLEAFRVLYEKYRQRVYGYVMRSCSDTDVAGELFQEVWVKVIAAIPAYEPRGRFRQWLIACAHNVIVDYYRKRENDPAPAADEPGITERNESLEIAERIEQALCRLPFEQRQAFCLRQEMNCSLEDIAEIQNCSRETAKSRLRYAYGKLRHDLEDLIK